MVLSSLASLAQINGIYEKIGVGMTMSRRITDPPMQILIALAGGIPALLVGEYLIATRVGLAYTVLPFIAMYAYYQLIWLSTRTSADPAAREKLRVECQAHQRDINGVTLDLGAAKGGMMLI